MHIDQTTFTASATTPLFNPLRVGRLDIAHRIVMPPLTRFRASESHAPTDMMAAYYAQRANTPGTLLIAESTVIAEQAGGLPNVPGVWTEEHIAGWKKVTEGVHAKGSFIFLQLWAVGRVAMRDFLPAKYDIVSSGDVVMNAGPPGSVTDIDTTKPRPLTLAEIDEYVELYAQAGRNALAAGFDGVEIHCAHGCLMDQFLQNVANNRTDEYGGSAENRVRLPERVVCAVAEAVGADRTAFRISPYERFSGMYMGPKDLLETFSLLLRRTAPIGLAYFSVTEPRVSGQMEIGADDGLGLDENIDWAGEIWFAKDAAKTNVMLVAGGYTPVTAAQRVEEATRKDHRVIVAIGRWFISNPDLVERVRKGIQMTKYDRSSFYVANSAKGYVDYPFADVSPDASM